MKNLVVLFVAFFSFVLISCSDVSDNSFLTNPVMEKSGKDFGAASQNYPYPYLFNFSPVMYKYSNLKMENGIEIYLDNAQNYAYIYVTLKYKNDITPRMIFLDKIVNGAFHLRGIDVNAVETFNVYGLKINQLSQEIISPFNDNTELNEVGIRNWTSSEGTIRVECGEYWNSNIKYLFAEIVTRENSYLVFLQKPVCSSFAIPEYGKQGVREIRLFGYQSTPLYVEKTN